MTDVLTNHQWDDSYQAQEKKIKENRRNSSQNNITNDDTAEKLLAQTSGRNSEVKAEDVRCFCCREKGHFTNDCGKIDSITRENWWLEKPENTGLKENFRRKNEAYEEKFRKKNEAYEAKKVSWSGTQVGHEIEQGFNGCQVHQPPILKKEHERDDINRPTERIPYPRQSCTRKRTDKAADSTKHIV